MNRRSFFHAIAAALGIGAAATASVKPKTQTTSWYCVSCGCEGQIQHSLDLSTIRNWDERSWGKLSNRQRENWGRCYSLVRADHGNASPGCGAEVPLLRCKGTVRDAQYLESRKYAVEEIARIYAVPPEMLA